LYRADRWRLTGDVLSRSHLDPIPVACALALVTSACRGRESPPASDSAARAGATSAVAAATCRVETRTPLTAAGIGDLRVGARVEDVARACRVLRDTTAPGIEGQEERRIVVDLGRDTVAAVVNAGRIWRVHVGGPAFRTSDSLGVGTRVRELRSRGPKLLTGEGRVFLTLPSHCGLSFRLRGVAPGRASSLRQFPDSVVVDEVLAFGCTTPLR
jgi:hypothetical protein